MLFMVVVENKEVGRKSLYGGAAAGGPMVFDTREQAFAHMKEVFGDNPKLAFTLVSLTMQS